MWAPSVLHRPRGGWGDFWVLPEGRLQSGGIVVWPRGLTAYQPPTPCGTSASGHRGLQQADSLACLLLAPFGPVHLSFTSGLLSVLKTGSVRLSLCSSHPFCLCTHPFSSADLFIFHHLSLFVPLHPLVFICPSIPLSVSPSTGPLACLELLLQRPCVPDRWREMWFLPS